MAAGLAVRMIPLALFMLLNAAIVRGIAARAERDLSRTVTKTVLLALVTLAPSGCRLMSRQEVFVGSPTQVSQFFNGGIERTECMFDLATSPQWVDGKFTLYTVTSRLDGTLSRSEAKNLHLAAVFELE
jgi:hypothetical protein